MKDLIKAQFLTNLQGEIIAIAPVFNINEETEGPTLARMTPLEGQLVHEVEVPGSFFKLRPEEMHYQYGMDFVNPPSKLIKLYNDKAD